VSTFDAGGGLLGLDILYNPAQNLGLDILYNPAQNFHNNAIIYVSIEVYDTAPAPNILYYLQITGLKLYLIIRHPI